MDSLCRVLDGRGKPIDVFFRDDDAGWSDEQLLHLLDVFARFDAPLDLAVIPCAITDELIDRLRVREQPIGLHQHGYTHRNHESVGRKCEFGATRSYSAQREDLSDGQRRLDAAFGERVDSIFTPPWNRCTLDTVRCLHELGFHALSRDASAQPFDQCPLLELPVCIDWQKKDSLNERMALVLRTQDSAGIMLHHAAMDEASREAFARLLRTLSQHPLVALHRMAHWVASASRSEQQPCA